MIVFAPGTRFVVQRIKIMANGHRVVQLRHPEEDAPPSSGGARGGLPRLFAAVTASPATAVAGRVIGRAVRPQSAILQEGQ